MAPSLILRKSDPLLWERLKFLPEDSVFGCPTDTIYGLSCLYKSENAKKQIQSLKKRDHNQFIVLVRNFLDAEILVEINEHQRRYLLNYWPGPITFILKARNSDSTLALRFPKDEFLVQLMETLGGPIISTSCNLTGTPAVANALAASQLFENGVDFYLDSESNSLGLASTLVDLVPDTPKVLRSGGISFDPSPITP